MKNNRKNRKLAFIRDKNKARAGKILYGSAMISEQAFNSESVAFFLDSMDRNAIRCAQIRYKMDFKIIERWLGDSLWYDCRYVYYKLQRV